MFWNFISWTIIIVGVVFIFQINKLPIVKKTIQKIKDCATDKK